MPTKKWCTQNRTFCKFPLLSLYNGKYLEFCQNACVLFCRNIGIYCHLKVSVQCSAHRTKMCQKIHCIYQFFMFSLGSRANCFGFSSSSQRSFLKFNNLFPNKHSNIEWKYFFIVFIPIWSCFYFSIFDHLNSFCLLKKPTKISPRTAHHIRQNTFTLRFSCSFFT